MQWVEYESPRTVEDAVTLLASGNGRAKILAGGTDVLVQLRAGRGDANVIVDIKKIPELMEISLDESEGLTLGAGVPCYQVYENADIQRAYPGLVDSTSLIGGIQIQGRASVGGNLCNSAPSADAIPMLIAYSVTCRIAGPNGVREVAAEDFCTAPGRNVLEAGEMLVSMHFPVPEENSGARYLRFIPRNEMDIAVAGVGVNVVLDNGDFKSARVALASVAPTPLFVREAGEALAGNPVNDESINAAAQIAKAAAKPITDMRGTVEYRKHLCEVLTRRALHTAVERARGAKS